MAISLSLFPLIILQFVMAAALHPKAIMLVIACFPWASAFLKIPSRQNAILGRNPQSSRIVKSGKNTAIGGSITDTTHAVTR